MSQKLNNFIFSQMVVAAKALGISSDDVDAFCKENHCDAETAVTTLLANAYVAR